MAQNHIRQGIPVVSLQMTRGSVARGRRCPEFNDIGSQLWEDAGHSEDNEAAVKMLQRRSEFQQE